MPILAHEYICYGACAYIWPSGLSRVAVYDDGAVSIAREKRAGDGFVITLFSLQLSATELAELRAAALTGGLGTGGIHAAGTTANSADGGGSVFFSRHGTLGTVIEAPLLFGDMVGWGDGNRRQRSELLAVQKLLNAIAQRSEATRATPAAYLTRGSDGACHVTAAADVTPAQAAALTVLTQPASLSDRGPAPSGRPLLPHEKTCADVVAWDNMLAAQSRARLVSP